MCIPFSDVENHNAKFWLLIQPRTHFGSSETNFLLCYGTAEEVFVTKSDILGIRFSHWPMLKIPHLVLIIGSFQSPITNWWLAYHQKLLLRGMFVHPQSYMISILKLSELGRFKDQLAFLALPKMLIFGSFSSRTSPWNISALGYYQILGPG